MESIAARKRGASTIHKNFTGFFSAPSTIVAIKPIFTKAVRVLAERAEHNKRIDAGWRAMRATEKNLIWRGVALGARFDGDGAPIFRLSLVAEERTDFLLETQKEEDALRFWRIWSARLGVVRLIERGSGQFSEIDAKFGCVLARARTGRRRGSPLLQRRPAIGPRRCAHDPARNLPRYARDGELIARD